MPSTFLSSQPTAYTATQPYPLGALDNGGWQQERPALATGTVLAERYRIDTVVGSGQMGVVYAASDTRLERPVAVKVLRPELANDQVLAQRFANEALLMANLASAHVVRVYDSGRLPRGVPFIVMEWVVGESLESVLARRGPLPVGEAADLVLDACAGLAEAHAAGVVHRDIKPANLMLCRAADGSASLKVVDFGISRRLLPAPDAARVGESWGSPSYMSPEQLTDTGSVDARSDVWALGVVLFELLTGRTPFDGASVSGIFAAILTQPTPSLGRLRHDVDAGLEAIVRRCLQKDPVRRYKNAQSLREALQIYSSQSLQSAAVFGWNERDDSPAPVPKSSSKALWGGLALAVGLTALVFWAIAGAPWPRGRVTLGATGAQAGPAPAEYAPRPEVARGVYAETTARGSLRAEPERPPAPGRTVQSITAPEPQGVPIDQVWVHERRVFKNGQLVDDQSQIVRRPAADDNPGP